MGLVDLSEQRKLSIIQIAVCVVLFLVSGYVSFKYLLSPEMKRLRTARIEYNKEKALLKSMADEAQRVNALANNAQMLEVELVSMRNRVFNSDAEILTFVRGLSTVAVLTNNSLTSITPQQAREIISPESENPAPSKNTNNKNNKNKPQSPVQTTTAPPRTLPCSLKPIEISFTGDYNAVIGFLNELKSTGQFITISSLNMSGNYDKPTNINVKAILNLLKMGITVNSLQPQMAKLTNNAIQQVASRQEQNKSLIQDRLNATAAETIISAQNTIYAQRNAQTTVQVAGSPQNLAPIPESKPVVTVATTQKTMTPSVQTINRTQPSAVSKQNATTANAVANRPTVASAKTAQPNQKLMPSQPARQMQTNVKTEQKAVTIKNLASSPKPTENTVKPAGKPASVKSYTGSATKPMVASAIPQKATTPAQQATAVAKPSLKPTQADKPAVSKKTQYAVRVGKFVHYENAENLVKTLKSHNYSPWIKSYSYSGKTTYWVYVGAFETKEKAEEFAESMQKRLAYIDDYVIMGIKSRNSKDS